MSMEKNEEKRHDTLKIKKRDREVIKVNYRTTSGRMDVVRKAELN